MTDAELRERFTTETGIHPGLNYFAYEIYIRGYRAAQEDCAKVCDKVSDHCGNPCCAAAIRERMK
jgi:hypothetical protein